MAKETSPYKRHLKTRRDLIAAPEGTRAGFASLALERNRRANPFVARGIDLRVNAQLVSTPRLLLGIKKIQNALLITAGVSDIGARAFEDCDKVVAIENLIHEFLEPAGEGFVDELVTRFLLACDDIVGESMHNADGYLAQQKLSRCIMASLANAGVAFECLRRDDRAWSKLEDGNVAGIEMNLRALTWSTKAGPRTLVYNLKVPIVNNNIDLCLLSCPGSDYPHVIGTPEAYVCLGELKGGIDPAGADEHWKTADSALSRIRKAFATKNQAPSLFFVGAAIAENMAKEIWEKLESKTLANAGNLTKDSQVASLCSWLTDL